MKRFLKTKSFIALLICTLFLTACTTAPQNESIETSNSTPKSSFSDVSKATESENVSQSSVSESKAENDTTNQENTSSDSKEATVKANGKTYTQSSNMTSDYVSSYTSSKTPSCSAPSYTNSKTLSSCTPSYTGSKTSSSSRPTANSTPSQSVSKPTASSSQSTGNSQSEYNQFSRQVIALVNEERSKQGLPALRENTKLMDGALLRSSELTSKFAHERPNGEQGYTLALNAGFNTVGENIAYGYQSPQSVMDGWMNSAGHRANILNKNFTAIGVGCYKGSNGQLYWTQLFGG